MHSLFTKLAFITACVQSVAVAHNATVRLVHQFQPITWVENLAVRPNGFILPVFQLNTSSILNQIDPENGNLHQIYDFHQAGNSLSGITTVTPDVFAIVVTDCAQTGICTPGSSSIWRVDLRSDPASSRNALVHEIGQLPAVKFPNGMATLNEGTVLLADSFLGGLWSIDIQTGRTCLLFTDPRMNGTGPTSPTGINGIRYVAGELYFTNSALNTFNRVSIDPITGHRTGDVVVVASGLNAPDDFALDSSRTFAYLAGGRTDALLRIRLATGEVQAIASLPGPTSARFGCDGKLYVSTNGGLLQGDYTLGGAVYEVDIS